MAKKPLEPLIPLEQLKKLGEAIARVPKEAVTQWDSSKKSKPKTKGRSKKS